MTMPDYQMSHLTNKFCKRLEIGESNLPECDVFIVHDDDGFTNETLLYKLDSRNVSYLSLENDSKPGKSKLENFQNLLSRATKVLFVLSEEMLQNEFRRFMVETVIQLPIERVFTLILKGDLDTDCFKLLQTSNVFNINSASLDDLVDAMRTEVHVPDFCKVVSSENTSNVLFLHGLCFQHFCSDIYGLMIVMKNKYLKVDLFEFSKHLDAHCRVRSDKLCGQCSYIRGMDTKVTLVVKKDFQEPKSEVLNMFARLCGEVCDGTPIRTNWTVSLSYEGPLDENQQIMVSSLHRLVSKIVIGKTNSLLLKVMPCFPQFNDFDERVQSFPEEWSEKSVPTAKALADAGFYFVSKPCRLQCFYCGLNITAVHADDNPLNLHLRTSVCPFLKLGPHGDKAVGLAMYEYPVKMYMQLSSRLETYHDFLNNIQNILVAPLSETENAEESILSLAEAGFYYLGFGSVVMCYMCGLRLYFRDFSIDPWFVHAELSTNCKHLKESKYNIQFIKQMKKHAGCKPTIVTFQLHVENQKKNKDSLLFSFAKALGEKKLEIL